MAGTMTALPDTMTVPINLVSDPDADARELQALSEGIVLTDTVECMGERYQIGDRVGLMPLMRFAHAAKKGVQSDDLEGLSAMYDMLHDCIHPDDWDRFETDMTAKRAGDAELMEVVGKTIEILSARPTRPRSDSSSGPSPTSPSSTAGSSQAPPRIPSEGDGLIPVADLGRLLAG